ncbi:DUF5722 domain-containing protein [Mucisphaera calidilacus]|nr:DUF5722 domain-containing protein [Mucisphaera calidilacus]
MDVKRCLCASVLTRLPAVFLIALLAACGVHPDNTGVDADTRVSTGEHRPGLVISATGASIRIVFPHDARVCRIESRPVHAPPEDARSLYTGPVPREGLTVPRFEGAHDRLYHRFGIRLDDRRYESGVTDVSGLSTRQHPMPWPKPIKGVSCPVDIPDLAELGARHTHINIKLSGLLLRDSDPDPPAQWIRHEQGVRLRLDPEAVASLDQRVRALTDQGVNIVAVILNPCRGDGTRDNLWLHPATERDRGDVQYAAFNLHTHEAVARYAGLMNFLAGRYSSPGKEHGWIGGYIIGNEVDAHGIWHNMGPASEEQVAGHYINELRVAWLSVRRWHPDIPIFASLTHSWTQPSTTDPERCVAGRALLDRLVALSAAQGDFGWHVAHHPYPQDLTNPRFWMDDRTAFAYDTPLVTFRNIEVLAAYLRLPQNRYRDKPRRLILSEQGFQTEDNPDGENLQAAAYALSYERIRQIPGIDAYILHRHVDHRGEGGLRLGLWTALPEPAPASTPGRRKRIWHVFRAAGTESWYENIRFALPILDLASWQDAVVMTGPLPDRAPERGPTPTDPDRIIRLADQLDRAEVTNALDCHQRTWPRADGGVDQAIYLHPGAGSTKPARLRLRLKVPDEPRPELTFGLYLMAGNGDGVVYRVLNHDQLLFEKTVTDAQRSRHRVDLSSLRGRQIALTLEVDARETNVHDWAYWVNPSIRSHPEHSREDAG